MSKKPLNENHVKSLRKLVEGNKLHELLLNIGCDAMLRSSDLLSLKVKDVVNEDGSVSFPEEQVSWVFIHNYCSAHDSTDQSGNRSQ